MARCAGKSGEQCPSAQTATCGRASASNPFRHSSYIPTIPYSRRRDIPERSTAQYVSQLA
jgi:hypothetical protein